MKKLLLLFLLTPQVIFTQQIAFDSLSIIKYCNCEKSITRYKDEKNKVYQVFLDLDENEIFIIERKKWYFRRKQIKKL